MQVARKNMPDGPVFRGTLAASAITSLAEALSVMAVTVPAGILVPGANVIAAEVGANAWPVVAVVARAIDRAHAACTWVDGHRDVCREDWGWCQHLRKTAGVNYVCIWT